MAKLDLHNGYPLWHYVPSLPAAIAFVVIFSLVTLGHNIRMFKHRMWFGIPMVVGGVFEIVGYVGRAMAHDKTGELMPYVIQSTLLLLAPILFAASLYMTLSRVVVAVQGQKHSPIAARWLTRIFVFGDIFSFIVQSSGAGLRIQAGNDKSPIDPKMGSNIIVGGLIFQIVVFAVFIITIIIFNHRVRRASHTTDLTIDVPWQQKLNMLYITSAFVTVRNIFRVAEYVMGTDGYLLSVEWGVYVFDASLMALTMAWFLWRYPHKIKQTLRYGNSVAGLEESVMMNRKPHDDISALDPWHTRRCLSRHPS